MKSSHEVVHFIVAGRNVPTGLIIGTLIASVLSSNTFLGDAGFVYGGAVVATVLWTVCIYSYYVHPFQLASGTLSEGQWINWWSGESLMCNGFLLVGLWVAWIVHRDNLRVD